MTQNKQRFGTNDSNVRQPGGLSIRRTHSSQQTFDPEKIDVRMFGRERAQKSSVAAAEINV